MCHIFGSNYSNLTISYEQVPNIEKFGTSTNPLSVKKVKLKIPQLLLKTIYFATTCTVFSLSAIAFTQPSQAITQLRLTNPTIIKTNAQEITDNFQLINQSYNNTCPNNQPRSCPPGGSR